MPDIPEVPSAFKGVIWDGTPKPLWGGATLSEEKLAEAIKNAREKSNPPFFTFNLRFSDSLNWLAPYKP